MTSTSQPSSVPTTAEVPTTPASARAALRRRVAQLQTERPDVTAQHLSPTPGRIRFSGLS